MMKRLLAFFMCIFMMLLSACYDASDIEETAYLIALGIDKGESGFLYTFQLASPAPDKEGGGEKGENPTAKNVVIGAEDFYTARNMFSNYLSKSLNMSHLKMIVCSKEIAESSFYEHSQLFSREREIRPGTYLAVSSKSAEEFLKAVNPALEGNTAKYYELINLDRSMLYAPAKRLGEFLSDMETSDGSGVLPVARVLETEKSDGIKGEKHEKGEMVKGTVSRVSDSKTELFGMGIFKKGKIIGMLDGNDAFMYNILTGFSEDFVFSVKSTDDEQRTLSFKVSLDNKPKIKVLENGEKIRVDVMVEGDIEYMGIKDFENFKGEKGFEKIASDALGKELKAFLEKTASTYGADVLKVGDRLKKYYLTQEDFEKINFEDKYPYAEFYVSVLF